MKNPENYGNIIMLMKTERNKKMSEEKPIRNFILQEYLDGKKPLNRYRKTSLAARRRYKDQARHLRQYGLEIDDIAYVLGISAERVSKYLEEPEDEIDSKVEAGEIEDWEDSIVNEVVTNIPLTEDRAQKLSDERTARIINALDHSSREEIMKREGITSSQFREILLSKGIIPESILNGEGERRLSPPKKGNTENQPTKKEETEITGSQTQESEQNTDHIDMMELKRRLAEQEKRAKEIRRAKDLSRRKIHSEKELYEVMREIFGLRCSNIAIRMGETYLRKDVLSPAAKIRLRKGLKKVKEVRSLYMNSERKQEKSTKSGEER